MNGFFPQPRIQFESGRWFHNWIVFLDRLHLLPPLAWGGIALAVLAPAIVLWPGLRAAVFFSTAIPLGLEALILFVNHRSGRSPGPFGGPFFLFLLGHAGTTAFLPLFFYLGRAADMAVPLPVLLGLHLLVQTGLLGAMVYGSVVEPFRVRCREERIELLCRPTSPADEKTPPDESELRLFLLSDLHLDRRGPREEKVLQFARAFAPHLILFPGDLTNLSFVGDPITAAQTRAVLQELAEIAPVYVSRGTAEVDCPEWVRALVEKTPARYLDNEAAETEAGGIKLQLIGIPLVRSEKERAETLVRLISSADGRPVILLHHSPDLIEEAARVGVSLYLAGHTHGGQIRLPFCGPLFTSSRFGRRYAFGCHHVGPTSLVVSQGIGMEGAGAPRLRFLSPPEVVVLRVKVKKEKPREEVKDKSSASGES